MHFSISTIFIHLIVNVLRKSHERLGISSPHSRLRFFRLISEPQINTGCNECTCLHIHYLAGNHSLPISYPSHYLCSNSCASLLTYLHTQMPGCNRCTLASVVKPRLYLLELLDDLQHSIDNLNPKHLATCRSEILTSLVSALPYARIAFLNTLGATIAPDKSCLAHVISMTIVICSFMSAIVVPSHIEPLY